MLIKDHKIYRKTNTFSLKMTQMLNILRLNECQFGSNESAFGLSHNVFAFPLT